MKRVLSLVLAISMVMSMFTFSFAGTSLKDVTGTEYQAAVEALVELGIVNGYEDGTYRPEQTVSRAEMAKLLVIAAGLEAAAELNEGATRFADVNGGWASGYINVASEYGYIMGDPDGNFRPDDTVSYAEAVTMALRVLGYKSVVEAKGTWPTNYIAKAEDLEMLEDITYSNYAEGAKRGNCAILIWNMLREQMWAVKGESDGDGLQYGKDEPMLNIKFPNYTYSKAEFVDFRINKDGEVEVTLNDVYDKYVGSLDQSSYVYAANDFYTFVEGTEVEVLVNEKDETLLTMVRTGRDSFDEGLKSEIDDEYPTLSDEAYDYVYAMIEKKDAVASTQLEISSEYIRKAETKTDFIRLNSKKYEFEDYDDVEVILNGDAKTQIENVKVDDVLSKVTVDGVDFYVVSSEKVTGKLTRYNRSEELDCGATYALVVVDGKEYVVDPKATYVVDREDKDEFEKNQLLSSAPSSQLSEMEDEEVTIYLDFAGRVARVEFDGDLKDEGKSNYAFFGTTTVLDYADRKYSVEAENADDSQTLTFAKSLNSELASKYFGMDDDKFEGAFGWFELDDEDEVIDFHLIARGTSGDDPEDDEDAILFTEDEFSADEDDDNHYFTVVLAEVSYDEKTTSLRDGDEDEVADVTDDVVVVTLVYDDNGTKKEKDDFRTVEFAEGLSALAEVDEEKVIIITEVDGTEGTTEVVYVVRFAENKSKATDLAAKITKVGKNLLESYYPFYVNGAHKDADVLRGASSEQETIAALLGGAIVYSTEYDRNDKLTAEITAGLTVDELLAAVDADDEDIVKEVTGSKVQFSGESDKLTFAELIDDDYDTARFNDDYIFVLVEIDPDAKEAADVVIDVEVVEEPSVNMFSTNDVLVPNTDAEVCFIVRGFDFEETIVEEEDDGEGEDEENDVVAEMVTITWNVAGRTITREITKGSLPVAPTVEEDEDLAAIVPADQEITGWVRLDEEMEEKSEIVNAFKDETYYAKTQTVAAQQPSGE